MATLNEFSAMLVEAYKEQLAIEKSLEPDPNADPVTQLDQAWRKERTKYVGMMQSNSPISVAGSLIIITFSLSFLGVGVMLWREANALPDWFTYFPAIFCIGCSLLFLLALPNAIKAVLGERRYRQKRALLVKHYGDTNPGAELLLSGKRLRYTWPKKSRSEAESRFHELQAEYYDSGRRDEAYYATLQRFIDHAPAADQRYLSELAQLEERWLKERFGSLRYVNQLETQQAPSVFGAWFIFGLGLGLIGFGVMLLNRSASLLYPLLCAAFGLFMLLGSFSIRKRAIALIASEQRYFAQRQQLSHDYGR
ncbi:hypothetical protein [Herpetosiphon giganteus]|uniref:hypothetical protein n=1 Tax=Herpetosiphon giganteus TaxID=2029754 RepID=UPI00195E4B04|nr:hypothetical protein [Herpetosiphon giganteus]MBM7844656.1 hypothetical protein [Herpetosiphon giganteus]